MKSNQRDDLAELLREVRLPPLAEIEAHLERRLRREAALKAAVPSDPAAVPPPPVAPLSISPFPPELPAIPLDLPAPPQLSIAPFEPLASAQDLTPPRHPPAPLAGDALALPAVDPVDADLPEPLDESALATPPAAPADLAVLRENQRPALELIMQGIGYPEAARRLGIGRRTLYRWVKEDPAFQRALDSWRSSAIRSAEDRLLRGAEVAASTLSAAAASDYRAAAILLKGRGLLDGRSSPADPSSVQAFLQAVPPGKRRVFELRLRELVLSLRDDSEEGADVRGAVEVEKLDAPPKA